MLLGVAFWHSQQHAFKPALKQRRANIMESYERQHNDEASSLKAMALNPRDHMCQRPVHRRSVIKSDEPEDADMEDRKILSSISVK